MSTLFIMFDRYSIFCIVLDSAARGRYASHIVHNQQWHRPYDRNHTVHKPQWLGDQRRNYASGTKEEETKTPKIYRVRRCFRHIVILANAYFLSFFYVKFDWKFSLEGKSKISINVCKVVWFSDGFDQICLFFSSRNILIRCTLGISSYRLLTFLRFE